MKMRSRAISALLLLLLSSAAHAQDLPRQGFLGIQIKATEGHPEVRRVEEGSTAAALGVQPGDGLVQLNTQNIYSFADVQEAMRRLRAGDAIEVRLKRAGREIQLKGTVIGKPFERSEQAEILYGAVPYGEGRLRTIVNKPLAAGKHPTIYFIPGYTCSSVDNLQDYHPYRKLIDSLSALGYAIFRVEKPGMGDNLNTGDCRQLGFDNELEAYAAAYPHIQEYDFVDPDNIFILGHSMGGIYAPILGERLKPKGIIVYGSVHEGWTEYLLKMVRFQNPRFGEDYVETHEDLQVLYRLLYEHYYLGKSSKELARQPDYAKLLERDFAFDGEDQILYRHEDFWREINGHNLTKGWVGSPSYVLSLFGEADIEALTDYSHREVVRICNAYKPGTAEFELVEGSDHSMIKVGNMDQGAALRGQPEYFTYLQTRFNYGIVSTIDQWIRRVVPLQFPEAIPAVKP